MRMSSKFIFEFITIEMVYSGDEGTVEYNQLYDCIGKPQLFGFYAIRVRLYQKNQTKNGNVQFHTMTLTCVFTTPYGKKTKKKRKHT